jgi:histidyl-tRNA synthetase
MKVNTNPVRGMKDFLPDEAELRERVRRTIIDTYTSFGYRKIETPVLEHLELLSGGDGGENEKLIFKVLKRGEKLNLAEIKDEKDLSEDGLRFDLTVPLTRIYANNQGNIPLPFKVIQTDYVFRAERPQKGRYRQFMQCDIDIIGEESYLAEIDLLMASSQALINIGFEDFTIKINDRKILHAMADKWGFEEKDHDSVFITMDKLDKIGANGILAELESKEFSKDAISAMINDVTQFEVGRFQPSIPE